MNNSNRRLIIAVVVIAIAGCLCIGLVGFASLGYFFWNLVSPVEQIIVTEDVIETSEAVILPSITSTQPEVRRTPTPSPDATTPILPSKTAPSTEQSPGESLPPEVSSQMGEIEQQVSQLRGLQSNVLVARRLLSREQLRQYLIDDFLKDYSQDEASDEALSRSALGLLNPDFDLYNFYLDLYSEQIAGIYDPKTDEMFVIQESGFHGPEKWTYAHEFVHALQDANYGTEKGLGCDEDAWEEDPERCYAYLALVEGDASFLETQWLSKYATLTDVQEIQEYYKALELPVFNSSPDFMREDFLFPYTSGQPFVEYLYDQGGWQAVDAAYDNPPASTEQILHPEKYPDDKPIQVEIPDLAPILGEGWREIDRGVMGEWYTYLILAHGLDPQAQIDKATAQNASAGWGGDAYAVYYNDQDQASVFVLSSTWDTQQDASEFNQTFHDYANARYGPATDEMAGITTWESSSDHTTFSLDGKDSLWISAPSAALEQAVRDAISSQ